MTVATTVLAGLAALLTAHFAWTALGLQASGPAGNAMARVWLADLRPRSPAT